MRFTAWFLLLMAIIATITLLNLRQFEKAQARPASLVTNARRALQTVVMSPPVDAEYAGDSVVTWGSKHLKVLHPTSQSAAARCSSVPDTSVSVMQLPVPAGVS